MTMSAVLIDSQAVTLSLLSRNGLAPHRDAVAPPQLPADTPVAFLAQPVEEALGVTLGVNLDPAGGHGVHRLLSEAGLSTLVVAHADEPLVRQVGLDRRLAAVGVLQGHQVGINTLQQPL